MRTRETEIAWAAGFFDGEGTTYCASGRHLGLSVSQVDRHNLHRFQRAMGSIGNIHRPYQPANARRPISRFAAYGAAAVACVRIMWPHLGVEKRDQALRVLLRYVCRPLSNQALVALGIRLGPDDPRPRAIELGVGIRTWSPGDLTMARQCIAMRCGGSAVDA